MAYLLIEIKGPLDSLALWKLVSKYGVNVTDIIDCVIVHGKVDYYAYTEVLAICQTFGECSHTYDPE